MWIMTTRGFFSAVEHREDPDLLLIRARAREDLERLCELQCMAHFEERIVPSPTGSDYPYRIWEVPKLTWGTALLELTTEIEYDNFKNAVKDPAHHSAYLKCWYALRKIGEDPANAAIRRDRQLMGIDPGAFALPELEPDDEEPEGEACTECGGPMDLAGRCVSCGAVVS